MALLPCSASFCLSVPGSRFGAVEEESTECQESGAIDAAAGCWNVSGGAWEGVAAAAAPPCWGAVLPWEVASCWDWGACCGATVLARGADGPASLTTSILKQVPLHVALQSRTVILVC